MKKALSVLLLLGLLGSSAAAPPPTPRHDVVTTYHGVNIHDPYRWLERAKDPAVQRWIDAQNAYADRVLTSFPQNASLTKRVRELALTGVQQSGPQLVRNTLFFMRETPPQAQPVLVAQAWPDGRQRVIVDTNASGGGVAISEVWPSPSGRYVAYGTAEGGSESTTIHVADARSGRTLPDALGPAGGGTTGPVVAWDRNERGLTYGRLPANSQFGIALYHHALGQAMSRDRLEFGRNLSRVAEYRLLSSSDGSLVAALVQFGDGSPYRVYLRKDGTWKRVFGASEGVIAGGFAGHELLLVATGGSDRGRIVAVKSDGSSRTLVGSQNGWAMNDVSPIAGGFLVTKVWGTRWRIDHYRNDGSLLRTVALPRDGIGIDGIASQDSSAQAVISYSGWTVPARWIRYDARSGALRQIYALKPSSPGYSNIRVHEFTAISKDGARIPVTVLAFYGTPRNGRAPTILTAYGGFDLPSAPHFIGTSLAWLERGGVLAVANIRGGDEFGESWHRSGMLTQKQNDFDDFAAATRGLIAHDWTSREHLGITGGSNGGLLMGAALTQHPELYRAVTSFVGIYDMLRHELWPNGTYNITEYGTVKNAAQFRALYAYSPLQHVRRGTAYPATLLETGENDPRVAPWQSRKFAAALQRATSSGAPVLLITRRNAGHGIGASFSQRVGNAAVSLIFLAHELGLAR